MATQGSVMAVIRASRPSFRNPSDAVAFAVHSSFLAAGYSLIATGNAICFDNPPLDGEEVGIEGWNELDDSYGFLYLKSEEGLKKRIMVKCLAIGDVIVVDVLDLKEKREEPFHIQINVKESVTDDVAKESNYREMYKNLQGLVKSLNTGIFNRLEPMEVRSCSSSSCTSFTVSHLAEFFGKIKSSKLVTGFTNGEEVGIEGWNELDDSYGFLYLKSEEGLKKRIMVKCLAIGDVIVVDVLDLKEKREEPFHIQINVKESVTDDVAKESNYREMYKNLQGLVKSLNTGIFNRLEPMEVRSCSSSSCAEWYIDRTDEPAYRGPCELRPLTPPVLAYPPVLPHESIGFFFGPYPPRIPGIDGVMLPGHNHPRWFGTGEHSARFGGVPGVPPGAPFVPIGDIPGFGPDRFLRQPPRRPRGGRHPDLQEHFWWRD